MLALDGTGTPTPETKPELDRVFPGVKPESKPAQHNKRA